MPRNNSPENPDYYSEFSAYPEPTQAADYRVRRDPPPLPSPPRPPWYRSAPALIAAGALTVIALGIVVFALLRLAPSSSSPTLPATMATSSSTPTSTTATTPTHHGYSGGSGGGAETTIITAAPQTVTETDTPVDTGTTATTTTDIPTTTSVAPTTDTSTVTQTVTVAPSHQQFFPRPQDHQ